MARIDVAMPQMGESIAEGTLSKWLKKVGDPVKRDEPMFEISTDKVDAEIPAPAAGVLAEILVQEGQTVAVQTVVARLETDASAAAAPQPSAVSPPPAVAAAPKPPAQPAAQPSSRPAVQTPAVVAQSAAAPKAPAPPAAQPSSRPTVQSSAVESIEERLRTKSSPLVRKIAAEHNLDITGIPGSGLAGRVTKNDVLTFLESGPQLAVASPQAGIPSPQLPAASPQHPDGIRIVPGPVVEPWAGDKVEPWSRIRKLTADHMIMSRRVSAHVHSLIEVDYTRIAGLRSRHKAAYAERGVNLTFLAFIASAVARNLRSHPVLNACVMGENTIYRQDVNLGIAVALDWGLIVPVIRHADELNLLGMARAINDLGERARTKKLSPDEVQKGTFTITNPGVFGTLVGLPILNQPQSGILAVGAIGKRPAVVEAPDGSDTIGIRTMGMLAMSFDHRIVDGADADRFLADVRKVLEDFPEDAV
jgi:pyruvate dehydrogenase E2 component (dihydrolipoamide acetyltransferase)